MERADFESLIEAVLSEALLAAAEGGDSRPAAPRIASTPYGKAEAHIGQCVNRLTASYRGGCPIAAPSSDYLPPCF